MFDALYAWLRRQSRVLNQIVNAAWWRIRGVRARDYRALCQRCSRSGQVHWSLGACRRFLHIRDPDVLREESAHLTTRHLGAPNAR